MAGIDIEESYHLILIIHYLGLMSHRGLITYKQEAELLVELNDKLHEALGLKE